MPHQSYPQPRAEPQDMSAPLFIKLTKYREILKNMNQIKININLIRDHITMLNELEQLKSQNMALMESALQDVLQTIGKMDSDFMKPTGFTDEVPEARLKEIEGLEGTISDLKSQISGLKQEIGSLA
jgi:hypothetical protein